MRTTTVTLRARALTTACCSTDPPTTVLHGIDLSVGGGGFVVIMGRPARAGPRCSAR